MKIKIAKKEIIHFIGIGGIGMSGLSLIMNSQGFKVQGSDINTNKNIERLKKEKIQIFLGQSKKNLNKATIVVVSSAIKNDNPELIEAKKRNIPVIKRGEMLANLVSLMKNIVVVGSHGKTTTTSLLAAIFQETKIDPTIINGGVINAIKNTAKLGTSDWSILEADESDGSFIHISPTYAIITNIDREHMDFYKSMNDLKNYFSRFVNKVPSFGKSFICSDDKINNELIKSLKNKNFYTYGQKNGSNLKIINIRQNKLYSQFDININLSNEKNQIIKNIKIPLLGIHNIRNAVGSIGVALSLGIPVKNIKRGLKNFKGVERRFNKVFTYNNVDVYDDYAHHPTEIKVVLEGIKKVFTTHEKICIFQPHRISRLKDLKKEFSLAFKDADTVILCPIYTAGEKIKLGFSYESFAKLLIKNSRVKLVMIENKFELAKYLKNSMYGKKLIVGMGAGSISSWIRDLPKLIYENTKVIRLEQNYRSTQNILSVASHLISNNQNRVGKTLKTTMEEGDLINLNCYKNGKDEAVGVSDEIEKIKKKFSLNNIAILVRAIFQTREFEERFLKIGLPYRILGGTKFYERAEIKDCVAYLRIIHQHRDDLAFERIVNNPKRSIGDNTIKQIHEFAKKESTNLEFASRKMIELNLIKPKTKMGLSIFLNSLSKWRNDLEIKKINHVKLLQIILDESGYSAMLKNKKDVENENRLENIKELLSAMKEFDNLESFLEHVSLATAIDQDWEGQKVNMMTMHAAKGLEFDVVFLPGWEEGLFPHQKSIEEKGQNGLEEERRLAYVGVTRAKKKALISFSMNRFYQGDWIDSMASRFIDELPSDYLEKNSVFEEDKNEIEDFEFNQDFEIDSQDSVRSPGWIRYQKRIK